VGLRNNSLFCYMNACMQCLVPIDELRDHFLKQDYAKFKSVRTARDDFSFCNGFYLFYKGIFKLKNKIVDPSNLRELVSRKFQPIMMHDS
jgi:ubiquitin C-terminal hydrolase